MKSFTKVTVLALICVLVVATSATLAACGKKNKGLDSVPTSAQYGARYVYSEPVVSGTIFYTLKFSGGHTLTNGTGSAIMENWSAKDKRVLATYIVPFDYVLVASVVTITYTNLGDETSDARVVAKIFDNFMYARTINTIGNDLVGRKDGKTTTFVMTD